MSSRLEFLTLDVFTDTEYVGNPLAIVRVPKTVELAQSQKQLIAREFNLSETVFLHESSRPTDGSPPVVTIDIFTTDAELPFAGHPTVGSGWYLLKQVYPDLETVTLRTKSGDIPVVLSATSPEKVRLRVAADFKSHPALVLPNLKSINVQPALVTADYKTGIDGPEPIVSIVKGMTFILLQLSSESALSKMQGYVHMPIMPAGHLGAWNGLYAVYAYFQKPDGLIRARLFIHSGGEDPATGSAACTLVGYLAGKKGPGEWQMEILQGVEMGRPSEITVVATVGEDGVLASVQLEGKAVEIMQGTLPV